MNSKPPPLSPVRILLYLVPSNLTILHGRIINQVTDSAPPCFRGTALFMPRLKSLHCSNVSHLFWGLLQSEKHKAITTTVFLHYERDWCDVRFHFCPREKLIFIFLRHGRVFFFRVELENSQLVKLSLMGKNQPSNYIYIYLHFIYLSIYLDLETRKVNCYTICYQLFSCH